MDYQENLRFNLKVTIFLLFSTTFYNLTAGSTFIYAGCSPSKFDPSANPDFFSALNTLLSSFLTSSSIASYNSSSSTNPPLYGLYQCRSDLPLPTCKTCVQSLINQLTLLCSSSLSAALQLDGCLVKYSTDNFLGVPDTTLVYKRCSPGTSNDGEFFRRRDDVMADLMGGVGFRVSTSGTVQGYTQCLGDLGANDCSQCVMAAVGRLKDACGGALSADVYLGQCYARYWASGYYPTGDGSDSSEDDVGKTVAIIVGILAGLALIVVLLSFLRKAFG